MSSIRRPALALLTAVLALAPVAAFAQTAPAPAASDAMKGDAMHGDSMHGDAMHGTMMTHATYMKQALAGAQADLAMQKEAMAMKGVDTRTVALAKKRAADDAEYIRLITVAMQAEHIGN